MRVSVAAAGEGARRWAPGLSDGVPFVQRHVLWLAADVGAALSSARMSSRSKRSTVGAWSSLIDDSSRTSQARRRWPRPQLDSSSTAASFRSCLRAATTTFGRPQRPDSRASGCRTAPIRRSMNEKAEGRRQKAEVKLLFVCMGNICRSPTAEGVMRALVARARASRTRSRSTARAPAAGTSATRPTSARPPPRRARGDRARGRGAAGAPRGLRRFDLILAMDATNQRDLLALAPDDERAPRCACCASSTRPRAAATSTSPTPTTAARTASSTCSTWSRRPAAGCSTSCGGRAAVIAEALARRAGQRGRARAASPAATSTRPARPSSTDGARAFVKTRPAPRRASTRARPPACAGSPSRARCAVPAVLAVRRDALPRPRVDRRGPPDAAGRRSSAAASRAAPCRRARLRRAAPGTPDGAAASARSSCPDEPAGDWPAFYAEQRLAPLAAAGGERGALAAAAPRRSRP